MRNVLKKPLVIPLERIVLVDELVRPRKVAFSAESTPGHLVHVVESGEVTQVTEGRPEVFREGDVVWYHECELIEGRVLRAPWRFITINFIAPTLAPPTDDRRILPAGPQTLALARRLLTLWRNRSMPAIERELRCVATLAELLLDFMPLGETPITARVYPQNAIDLWWRAEKKLREHLDEPADLQTIARLAGLSVRTTIRACKAATGMPPIQRLRELRLSYAHSLLHYSERPITDVAFRIGYARVQEFSRDFKKHYGCTPREIRKNPPEYRRIEPPRSRQPSSRKKS
jgi:AraC-like DNA-binding protein